LCDLPKFESAQLLVGFDTSDDAAVYQINETQAIIQTLDFFTPIVDDPYHFGAIAAANALSDVYAMGGKPVLALNIVGFPNCLSPSILKEILRGGADKVKESGAILVGGHSIEDNEPKFGLSVMGMVAPDRIWRNDTAKPGDAILLTKTLGMGILTTALKEGLLDEAVTDKVIKTMSRLNKAPAEAILTLNLSINACTDITGFGLIGHSLEMARGSKVTITLDADKIPYMEEALSFAQMGIIPAGAYKNREFSKGDVIISENIDEALIDICFDPQTSGGLLISAPEESCLQLIDFLEKNTSETAVLIGKVEDFQHHPLIIK